MATPSPSSELELNQITKGIAILAVVFLHILSTFFPDQIYQQGSTGLFFITINQICRFSVPLFIALSGFGLGKKYGNSPPPKIKFYLKQLKKLLPQYILWSLVLIFLFEQSLNWQNRSDLFQKLVTGRADYHFYFIPLIIKFYLIYPFLPRLKLKHYFLSGLFIGIAMLFYRGQLTYLILCPLALIYIHPWEFKNLFRKTATVLLGFCIPVVPVLAYFLLQTDFHWMDL